MRRISKSRVVNGSNIFMVFTFALFLQNVRGMIRGRCELSHNCLPE